jgi:D-sedoheptulose 7-phosphate isomerase
MKKDLVAKSPARNPGRTATSTTREVRAAMPAFVNEYQEKLDTALRSHDWTNFNILLESLHRCWRQNRQVFLCGNGGSAANAVHLANDFLYGIDKTSGRGLRVTSLAANTSVLTCLANDVSYEEVYSQQLKVLANAGDVLIVLSGSGNSPNVVRALMTAHELALESFAILGFTGGQCLGLADHPIYFPVHDMQVAEDLQTVIGHLAMQWLSRNRP